MQNEQYLLGVGNVMMTDDGIGSSVVDYLQQHFNNLSFDLVDVGGDSLKILYYLESQAKRLLIVDAVFMGLKCGEFLFFTPEQVVSDKTLGNFSTHSGDVLQVLNIGKKLGYVLPKISIMGIEPNALDYGIGLSQQLIERLPEYAQAIIHEFNN